MKYINLKETRQNLGMSLKAVSDGADVSVSTIRNWERQNALTSIYKRDILAEIYHVDPNSIKLLDTNRQTRLVTSDLRKLRQKQGLTIKQVADALDTTVVQISKWETVPGGISSTNAIKLGNLYGVPGYHIEELIKKYNDEISEYEKDIKEK